LNMDLYTLYILSMALLSIIMVVYMAFAILGTRSKKEPEKRIVTLLRCPSCGYTKTREFREGDFVGKVTEEKCPKCGENMVIDAIYEESLAGLKQAISNKSRDKGSTRPKILR